MAKQKYREICKVTIGKDYQNKSLILLFNLKQVIIYQNLIIIILFIASPILTKAQTTKTITNYQIADSLFQNFVKNIVFQPDSLPILSLSPSDFKNYIKKLQQKQLTLLDSFAINNNFDSFITSLFIAKITYQNHNHLLQHPIINGFFEVQQNEAYSEQIKSFYRISYKDYSSFLDSLEINNENYLVVSEYVTFLENYLSYQEIRFHIFNSAEKCTSIDTYWLARLLFTGKIRQFMTTKILDNLQKSFSSHELQTVLKDYNQKFNH